MIKTKWRSSICQDLLILVLLFCMVSDEIPGLFKIIGCYAHSSKDLKTNCFYINH